MEIVLDGMARPLAGLIGQLVSRQPSHPLAHWIAIFWLQYFICVIRQRGEADSRRWRVLLGSDFHIATCYRGDSSNMRAVSKMAEESSTKVTASMKSSQYKIWAHWFINTRTDLRMHRRSPSKTSSKVMFCCYTIIVFPFMLQKNRPSWIVISMSYQTAVPCAQVLASTNELRFKLTFLAWCHRYPLSLFTWSCHAWVTLTVMLSLPQLLKKRLPGVSGVHPTNYVPWYAIRCCVSDACLKKWKIANEVTYYLFPFVYL